MIEQWLEQAPLVTLLMDNELRCIHFGEYTQRAFQCVFDIHLTKGDLFLECIKDVPFASSISVNCQKALQGESIRIDRKTLGMDGRMIWYRASYVPLLVDEKVIGIGLHITNIELEKNLDEQLITKKQFIDEMIQFQSHELRSPITQIKGLLSLLNIDQLDSYNREIIDMLANAGNQLDRMVHDLVEKGRHNTLEN